jgi:MFS family permease
MTHSSAAGTNKDVVLAVTTISGFAVPFLVSSINVALPEMGSELHMEAVVMSWVNTIYFLAIAVAQVPLGRLADIYGRKKIYILGLVIATLASLGGAMAKSSYVLLISRAFQGIGAGMTSNTIIAILTSVYPAEARGKALGISMAGTYGGLIFGPLLGGYLTRHFGWQSIFILSGFFGVLLIILVFLFLKGEWCEARGEKFDIAGALIYGAAIAMFMYGFSSLPTVPGFIFLLAGLAGLFYFIRHELKVPSPIVELGLFRSNRVFSFSSLATLINYLATFAVTFLLSLYLQYIKALTPDRAGLVLIASSIPMTIITPLAGRLSDKIEPRLVAASGMAIGCLALVLLVFLNNTTSVWYVVLVLLLYGTGIGLFSSPNTNAIMGSVGKKVLGVASGTVGTMRTGGMMLSMGIMMILFTVFIGQAEITPEHYPQFLTSVRVGFIIFAMLGIGGMVAQLAARKKA